MNKVFNPIALAAMPMLNAYKYDQLNRLKESRSYESGLSSNVWNPTTYGNEYYNAFEYDAMGNILSQVRHNRAGTKIEDMKYKYQYLDPTTKTKLQRNRLYHIYEPLSLSSLDATDIDNMGAYDSTAVNINSVNNYVYDEEGRLVKDKAEEINKIVWRVDGKVKEIQRMTGSTKWLKFDYDAMGNRIAKHVYNNTGTTHERSTYYILDAQGNQISTYDHEIVGGSAKFHLKERNIFGSSRIGSKQDSLNVLTATLTQNYTQILGTKYYEFSNHLGNVLTVFSDVKIALDANANGVVDGYRVPIRNTADYSPFGVQLDGRTISMDSYRRGFNGMEKDDEVKGGGNSYDFGARMYDARVGRWLTIDPVETKHPDLSTYNFVANSPLMNIDFNGEDFWIFIEETTQNNSGHAAIAVEEYSYDKETKEFTKTGRIIVYENYPKNLADIDGPEPVDGKIKKTVFNSIDEFINKEKSNIAGVEGGDGSGHNYQMIKLKSDPKEDYQAKQYGDMVKRSMEKQEGESGKMYYDPKDYSCSGFVAHLLMETIYKDNQELGAQQVSFKFKGVPISTNVITPNKLFNDLLNKSNDILEKSSSKPMNEEAAGKYVENYANQ